MNNELKIIAPEGYSIVLKNNTITFEQINVPLVALKKWEDVAKQKVNWYVKATEENIEFIEEFFNYEDCRLYIVGSYYGIAETCIEKIPYRDAFRSLMILTKTEENCEVLSTEEFYNLIRQ